MAGDEGYRQNFTMTRVTAIKTFVNINGKTIPADSVFASTSASSLNWTNNSDVQIVKLGADKNFRTEYRAYMQSGKKMLILVDPQFTAIFKTYAERLKERHCNQQG